MRKAEITRNKIYNVAHNLFEQKGFRDTTIPDICKAANISRTTFFNHFKSKSDLLVVSKGKFSAQLAIYAATLSRKMSTKEKIICMYKEDFKQSKSYIDTLRRINKHGYASITEELLDNFDTFLLNTYYYMIVDANPTADEGYCKDVAKLVTQIFVHNLLIYILRKTNYDIIGAMTSNLEILWQGVTLK